MRTYLAFVAFSLSTISALGQTPTTRPASDATEIVSLRAENAAMKAELEAIRARLADRSRASGRPATRPAEEDVASESAELNDGPGVYLVSWPGDYTRTLTSVRAYGRVDAIRRARVTGWPDPVVERKLLPSDHIRQVWEDLLYTPPTDN